jgi:hypothetical protein
MYLEDIVENIPNSEDFLCIFTEENQNLASLPCIVYNKFATQRYVGGKNRIYYIGFQVIDTRLVEPDLIKEKMLLEWKPDSVIISPILVRKQADKYYLAYTPGMETKYRLARKAGRIQPIMAESDDYENISEYMKASIKLLIKYDEKIQNEQSKI